MAATQSVFKKVRVRKEDSAFVYSILESHGGVMSYSTLPHVPGSLHRDLELRIAPDFLEEADRILKELGQQLGEPLHEIDDETL